MRRRLAAVALAFAAVAVTVEVRAQQVAPRDIWPQAVAAARDGDVEEASRRTQTLLTTGRTHGIQTFPQYAAAAAGLASEHRDAPDVQKWASQAAAHLDSSAPAVAFSEADRLARTAGWGKAVPVALQGFGRAFGDYRTNLLTRADLTIVAAIALSVAAILLAISLFIRYGRSLAHDFREFLSSRFTGGSVSVLAFALLFLPLFLWLGPVWLLFYWAAVFFPYADLRERIATGVLLLLVALLPLLVDASANRIAGVESPVVMAALSSQN
ncbi:MAG TPA: hypothetical protein VE010_18350, partial [Thermoanaerobaculia bacterium]|nr:hypothetical protein [Thermoanaerobaculia bacterium]